MKALIIVLFLFASPSFANCRLEDKGSFKLLLWNVKEDRGIRNLPIQLVDLNSDFYFFQEASAFALRGLRERNPGHESLDIHNSRRFGVASLSKTKPCLSYTVEVDDEPVLPKIDKGLVVQVFELPDGRSLKMVNVHLALFIFSLSYGEGGYKKGLRAIKKEVSSHEGPLIIAGDFNGWSPNRMHDLLPEFVNQTNLLELQFHADSNNRASWLLLDRIFYRGVDPVEVETHTDLDVSDHYLREVFFEY